MSHESSAPPVGVPMLDFSRQSATIRQEIREAITEVCDSHSYILGPQVDHFERSAALMCGSPFAVGCASGTDALWLALAACGIESSESRPRDPLTTMSETDPKHPVDAVITSPFSFFATASSILRAGARPLFADIDPRTFNLSPGAVEELLQTSTGRGVRAILPVHLYGQCADWDAFSALKSRHPNLLLIEDAAQAFGAEWTSARGKPRRAGSLGDAAAFSFYPTKNLAAMGDAGMVSTPSAEVDRRVRSLRAHGMTRRYFHDEVGWNSRLDSIQAAVLAVKLRYLPVWNQRRRALAEAYDELFRAAGLAAPHSPPPQLAATTNDGIVLPYTDPRATHIFHQYVIRAPRRDALRRHLTERQIGSEIYYPVPLHLQAALKDLGYKPGDFPEAERAADEVLALPIYPELRDEEQKIVVDAIRSFYG